MGLGGILGKIVKVVAVVAAVVAVGYLVAPTFMSSLASGIAEIGGSLGQAVASGMTAIGDAVGASTVAAEAGSTATSAAAQTAAEESFFGASNAMPSLAEAAPATSAATGEVANAGASALTEAGKEAATSTIPAAQPVASAAPDVASAASGPGDGLLNAATVQADPSAIVQSGQAQVGMGANPALDVNANAKDLLLARGDVAAPMADNSLGGMLSRGFDATKQFVKDNPLLASMGFKAGAALLAGDPMQRQMEFEDWLRNRTSQSVTGSYRPANTARPQQPLQRLSGGNVFNRPGMLGRTGG